MYPSSFRYHRVSSLAEASAALASLAPDAKVLAGGQTLIPLLKLRLLKPTDLIDIGRVSEAHFITEDASGVHFGALSTHAAIGTSDVSARHPILNDCSLGIADTQTRTLGTVGGSIAEADPSSCWALTADGSYPTSSVCSADRLLCKTGSRGLLCGSCEVTL